VLVSINQPCYLPWCGLVERIDRADVHIHLDDAQFIRRSFFARNRVVDHGGREVSLTVPVHAHQTSPIHAVALAGDLWRRKHLASLKQIYGGSPAAAPLWDGFAALLDPPYASLADLNIALTGWILSTLGIPTPTLRASELGVPSARDERLVDLCRAVGGDAYYSPGAARAYIRPEVFLEAGVRLLYQDYAPAPYPQSPGRDFVPYLSVIDPLFRHGPRRALEIVRAGAGSPRPA